jgi:hypothetical protein
MSNLVNTDMVIAQLLLISQSTVNVKFVTVWNQQCGATIIKYSRTCLKVFYRVSIKSFLHYKHLLQENYVEYKHFFFLMKLKKFFFYYTLVHFNMCSFCCTENV